MDSDVFLVAVGLVAASFVVLSLLRWHYSKDAATRRELKSAQRVAIREVADGAVVKIGGRLSYAGEPMTAPLSGRPCACWEVVVERRVQRGKHSAWEETIRDQAAQAFYIEDDTGRALVEASHPTMALSQDAHYRSGTFNDATDQLERFLERYGKTSMTAFGFNKDLRYREGVLEAGEVVSAYGRARLEPDPDGGTSGRGYREAAMRVVIGEPDAGPMMLSDDPGTAS